MEKYTVLFIFCLLLLSSPFSARPANAYTPPVPEKYTWRGSWTLYPADADLRFARSMFFDRKAKPHTLSAWENGSAVMFPVHISEAGTYTISITYSRFSVFKKNLRIGVFAVNEPLFFNILDNIGHFYAEIPPTGDNWNTYTAITLGSLTLPQGSFYLVLSNKDETPHEYVMNLRQVRLDKK